jgi:hypothetical protein
MSAALQISAEVIAQAKSANLAAVIGQTVRLHREGKLFAGRCPFHGEKTPSFYVYPKDQHYHCFGCGAHGDAVDFVRETRQLSFPEAVAWLSGQDLARFTPAARPAASPRDNRNIGFAEKIWREAAQPEGTLVEDYLRSRRLTLPEEPVLRFHPECPNGKDLMPAMVALMTDPVTGAPRGIHRTFLAPDGSEHRGKMMLGPAGVIRLCERITNGLGIAEGIETALAVAQRVGWGPVWATGSAGGIARFPVLPMTTLHIFCDHDENGAGLKAAWDCARRWTELVAWEERPFVHKPPEGKDWDEATLGEDVP